MAKGRALGRTGPPGREAVAGVGSDALFDQAMALHRQGQLAAAEAIYRRILGANPSHLDALQLLGVIEFQSGHFEAAAALLRQAVSMAPEAVGLHCNLGLALQQLGRAEEALACQDRALALKPDFAEALNNRGSALLDLKRPDEAVASFESALRLRPDFGEALYNLGATLVDLQRPAQALECLGRCLQLIPDRPEALGKCGVALLALGRPQEALGFLESALRLQPGAADALYWRGNALLELGHPDAAVASYRQALLVKPDVAEAHYNLANTLLDLGRHDEALAAYGRALQIRPDYVEALYNRSGALQELGRFADAGAGYERLLQIAPGHRYAPGKLFHCRQFCCDWTTHADDVAGLVAATDGDSPRDMPFSFLAVADDPARQLRCARAYTARKYPAEPEPAGPGRSRHHERLRVAYVSADFREHAVSYLLAGVFEAHDRARFETIAISLRPPDASAMGRRVATAFERFVDASRLRDAEVAALMRDMEVDIAVDLTGYTDENRTAIFARRAAPVQVNFLGFPGTMGAHYIDYIIADEFVIPPEMQHHYAERVAWLPDCFQGNDDRRAIAGAAPTRSDIGLPESAFVFCAFNNLHKFNPQMFDVWMRLLRQVEGSVLWIAADAPVVRANLAAEAARRGIEPGRLVFSPRIAYEDHLARMRLADLFLDTLPFNAGTTASDALWAGLPVLTCAGESFAARMAGSLLAAVGLPELVTYSLDEYEALALKLATTPALLADIRTRLAENRTSAPLFDTGRFTRHLEAAYGAMWVRHQRGEAPATFRVAPPGR